MEAQWGFEDGHWGRQMATWGPPKVRELGHLVVLVRIYPPPLVGPKSKGTWALGGWDEDFGGPYMSFGQSIVPRSLVAP